jgi:hypothetical protein
MEFDKPWVYKNWNVFDDVVLTNLNLSDCGNTINGFCEHTDTPEECIAMCRDAPQGNCTHGYFIQTPDRHNYCVPLRDHTEVTFPYHRLRQKDYYPIMKDMKTSFFANRDVYPFPPFNPNMVFYRDKFILRHKDSGLDIGTNNDTLTQSVTFSMNTSVYVQLVPKDISRSKVDDYVAVKNGDEVVINIPGTAFVFHRTPGDKIVWQLGISNSNTEENVMQIFTKGRPLGEILSFDDEIYFTSFKDILLYTEKTLRISQDGDINDTPQSFFTMIPKVEVSYCDRVDSVCKKISLDQADLKGYEAYYHGNKVYRSFCWINCGKGRSKSIWWVAIVLSLLFSLLLVLHFKKLLIFK